MISKLFYIQSASLRKWICFGFIVLCIQLYLNTGTLSGYAGTLDKPTLYGGYYVNNDYPQYVANYNFIIGAAPQEWERGMVLRRQLMYIWGYPFMHYFGFFYGSMITILLTIFISFFFFFKFIEREFGEHAAKVSVVLLCTYSGVMYWIGSPFVQNLIIPLCLAIYFLLYKMQQGSFKFNVFALIIIGILFTGYDLLPLFAPGILLFILARKKLPLRNRLLLLPIAIMAFALPQWLIRYWLIVRGANFVYANDDTYKIILTSYLSIFQQLPAWWWRVKQIPETLYHCYFDSNFLVLPILFLVGWTGGRLIFKFKLNLIERCLLISILFLFLFNNMAPPYEGEWQMWGDWIARIYQAVFIVYMMYMIRLAAYVYKQKRLQIALTTLFLLTAFFNVLINTGGMYASSLTSEVYARFYKQGSPQSYSTNIKYYGARPRGFPRHYENEVK